MLNYVRPGKIDKEHLSKYKESRRNNLLEMVTC